MFELQTKNCGNCYLEMIMFFPVAMLLLLGGTDLGLSLVERATLRDIVREGLQDQQRFNAEISVLDADGEPDENQIRALALRIANRIGARIIEAKSGLANGNTPADFRVDVTAIVLRVDPIEGSIDEVVHEEHVVSSVGNPQFNLGLVAPSAPYIPPEVYRDSFVTNAKSMVPSRYAIPTSVRYAPDRSSDDGLRYLPYSILLHANVTALTQGFHGEYLVNKLGSLYGFQEQQIMAVRTLLNG